jgi:hypothetical protein
MNRTVKLYRSVKRSGGWGIEPIADNRLKNLKDLPEGEGNYYLAYYLGKSRRMPSVGRFSDIARQKLGRKRTELDAGATGVELPPEPPTKADSSIATVVADYLEQQQAFVGNDGYGAARKSITAYRNRLDFYLRFCAEQRVTDLRLRDYAHLMKYMGWLRKQVKRNGQPISDRYGFNIFSTLGTLALEHGVAVPNKKCSPSWASPRK